MWREEKNGKKITFDVLRFKKRRHLQSKTESKKQTSNQVVKVITYMSTIALNIVDE